MCGIVGIVSQSSERVVRAELLRAMTDTMTHRGPDGWGTWMSDDGCVGLGHRRLSIMDLSEAGRQPMPNADGTVQVTFNGEIYNFRALRRELEARGHRFRSESDTEVLVYLYEELGDAMVERLDGDFALGLWDGRRRRLLLARDRVGVKPLYYCIADDQFLFASEMKALLRHPAVPREVDDESLHHYLSFLVVPAPRTLVRAVHKLPAGGMLTLELGRPGRPSPHVRQYWEPLPGQATVDPQRLDEQFADLFARSVEKRLMSDVPVGVLFSGGVDSVLNTAYFRDAMRPQPVRTYTVGVRGAAQYRDESDWARAMASRLGSEHHEVMITEDDLLDTARRLAVQQDEPVSDPVCVPLYFVTKLAKETGTTVLHAGEGADEIFCGYDNYRRYLDVHRRYWRPLTRVPRAVSALGFQAARLLAPPTARKHADILRRRALGQELFLSGAVAYTESEKAGIVSREFRARTSGLDSFAVVEPLYRRVAEARPGATFLEQMTYIELQLRLPELLLMRVDKMAMANAVEVRVPFLDRDLVDFALTAPEAWKLRDGISKEPVKRRAAQYVSRDLIYRPKSGFGAPILDWFHSSLGSDMRRLMHEDRQSLEAYFDVRGLDGRLAAGPSSVNQAFQLWVVYNFLNWRRGMLLDQPAA